MTMKLVIALLCVVNVSSTPPLRGGALTPSVPNLRSRDSAVSTDTGLHNRHGGIQLLKAKSIGGNSSHKTTSGSDSFAGQGRAHTHPAAVVASTAAANSTLTEKAVENKPAVGTHVAEVESTVAKVAVNDAATETAATPKPELSFFASLWARLLAVGDTIRSALDEHGHGRQGPVVTGRPAFAPEEEKNEWPRQNRIEEREQDEDEPFGDNPKYFWGLPKIIWALIADVVAMLIFVACIPFILSVAKRGSCIGRALQQLTHQLSSPNH